VSRRMLAPLLSASLALSTVAALPLTDAVDDAATTHVVVLDGAVQDVAAAAEDLLGPLGLAPARVFDDALQGFTVPLPTALAETLADDPLVDYVEADRTFAITAQTTPPGIDRVDADEAVDSFGTGASVDVDVAVIDTGADPDHADLDIFHRADCTSGLLGVLGFGLLGSSSDDGGCEADAGVDDQGHGTHVAGTIGALDDGSGVVGVAPGARIWAIKVLGGPLGTGSTSDVIAGIDYATAHADEIEVINMSLGGLGTSQATDDAIAGATAAGIVVVVAAGNDGADAAGYTPANSPHAITVSAITDLDGVPGGLDDGTCSGGDDAFATYSNHGDVVDIAAPGSCIESTRNGGGTTELSGTSMAAPHVAGAAAWYVTSNGVDKTASRWSQTLNGLLSTAAAQTGECGFTGGVSDEPLLDLASGC
jgi:subtilisin